MRNYSSSINFCFIRKCQRCHHNSFLERERTKLSMKVFSFALAALISLTMGEGKGNSNGVRRRRLEMTAPCVLYLKETRHDNNGVIEHHSEWTCELQGTDMASMGMHQMYDVDTMITSDMGVVSGGTSLYVEGGVFTEDGRIECPVGANPVLESMDHGRRNLAVTTGQKSILAVRVDAADSSTTSNVETIHDAVFGTPGGDQVNLASQYSACSHGQLNITGTVDTVSIGESVSGANNGIIQNAVNAALGSLSNDYDHVMLCLPPGTSGSWIAYAYVNGGLSVYNNEWCKFVSAQMHEIGHNLNLGHSGESQDYDDQSGMMGYSYGESDTKMCFNGAKTYQLGWYSDRHVTFNPLDESWSGRMVGAVDYGVSQDEAIVVRIVGDQAKEYYVNFNRKTGFNAGTKEGANQVLVTSRAPGTGFAASTLVAKLNNGQEHSFPNFGGTQHTLNIKVTNIDTSSSPSFAEVEITGAHPVTDTPPPTPTPMLPDMMTPAPTLPPTLQPTMDPSFCNTLTRRQCRRNRRVCRWRRGRSKCGIRRNRRGRFSN